jgi:hypothetical protein
VDPFVPFRGFGVGTFLWRNICDRFTWVDFFFPELANCVPPNGSENPPWT